MTQTPTPAARKMSRADCRRQSAEDAELDALERDYAAYPDSDVYAGPADETNGSEDIR